MSSSLSASESTWADQVLPDTGAVNISDQLLPDTGAEDDQAAKATGLALVGLSGLFALLAKKRKKKEED